MNDPAIATAADYADAMYTARRAKNLLVLLIFAVTLVQMRQARRAGAMW